MAGKRKAWKLPEKPKPKNTTNNTQEENTLVGLINNDPTKNNGDTDVETLEEQVGRGC